MNWDALGAIAETLGAVGVIATLGYLALQIKNNTRTTKAATFDSILAEWRQHQRDTYIANPHNLTIYVHGMQDVNSLSPEEQRIFLFILGSETLFIQNMVQQHQHGNVSEDQLSPWLDFHCSQLHTPGGQVFWSQQREMIDLTFRDAIDEHLKKTNGKPTILDVMPLLNPKLSDDS